MIETFYLAAGTVMRLNDPWSPALIQFAAVFFGALAAGVINYYLQKRNFSVQNERNWMNRRIRAYSDLLHDINDLMISGKVSSGMSFNITQVRIYGSPEAKAKLNNWFNTEDNNSLNSLKSISSEMASLMKKEIEVESAKSKS